MQLTVVHVDVPPEDDCSTLNGLEANTDCCPPFEIIVEPEPSQTYINTGVYVLWENIINRPIGAGARIVNEIPTGVINGSNPVFTTSQPFVPESLDITINGLSQKIIIHYQTSGNNTITFIDSPEVGDVILIDYEVA